METRVLTAHVPVQLAEKVDELATRLERSRGWIVKQALADWIELEEERRRLTLEAMADVDQGNVVDQEEIEKWAASLGTDKPLPRPL
ncbi:CopG family ribbon-helix-helix protein [Neorhizobium tomejilense]|uniref:CopG family ribbon-helix-helix protein n=1 Tax=Neorhizobium tomejilense TaxID=2093828 RepID=UPI003ECD82C6